MCQPGCIVSTATNLLKKLGDEIWSWHIGQHKRHYDISVQGAYWLIALAKHWSCPTLTCHFIHTVESMFERKHETLIRGGNLQLKTESTPHFRCVWIHTIVLKTYKEQSYSVSKQANLRTIWLHTYHWLHITIRHLPGRETNQCLHQSSRCQWRLSLKISCSSKSTTASSSRRLYAFRRGDKY